MQLNIYFTALIALSLSILFNFSLLKLSKNINFVKLKFEKRLVNQNIPPLGGIGIAFAFLISVRLLGKTDSIYLIIGLFGLLVSLLGAVDDRFILSWKIKLIFQTMLAAGPILYLNLFINIEQMLGFELNNYLNKIISVFWIILLINSINFVDNMDGLASVVTGSICIQIIILTYIFDQNKLTDVATILLSTIIGFLIFNYPPAKIYLGDSGSTFIGFLLGFISILFTWNNFGNGYLNYFLSPILLFFTIPILDLAVIVNYRISNKISPTTGGTDHISHRLLAKGLTQKKVLLYFLIYSFSNFALITALLLVGGNIGLLLMVFYLCHFIVIYYYLNKLKVLT
jgi:UDP-GlcNAc:undecaprenyl-phosphate GlcNAc-1-phosphate transferase